MHNLLMLSLTVYLASRYLEQPGPERLSLLCLTAVLLAQCRYESILFVVPTVLVILLSWWRRREIALSWVSVLSPLFLLPAAWHIRYSMAFKAIWETKAESPDRFGLHYLERNLRSAWHFFSNTELDLANSLPWLFVLICALALASFSRAVRRSRARGEAIFTPPLLVFGCFVLMLAGMQMFYFWGQLDDVMASRFSLPLHLLGIWCILLVVARIRFFGPRLGLRLAGLYAVSATLCLVPKIAHHAYTTTNPLVTEVAMEVEYLKSLPPAKRLVLSGRSSLPFLVMRTPCIGIDLANERAVDLRSLLKEGFYDEILVFQTLLPAGPEGGFNHAKGHRLSGDYAVQPLWSRSFGVSVLQVGKVLDIRAGVEPAPGDRAVMAYR